MRKFGRRGSSAAIDAQGIHWPTKTLMLYGPVNRAMLERVTNFCLRLAQTGDPAQILLNTPGGSVVDGLAIHDLLSALDNHLTIRVVGEACSMGAVILQAADHRAMAKHAVLMLHDGSQETGEMTVRDLEKYTAARKKDRAMFYRIFADRTGKPAKHFRTRMANDWYLYAKEALTEGLVDEILD